MMTTTNNNSDEVTLVGRQRRSHPQGRPRFHYSYIWGCWGWKYWNDSLDGDDGEDYVVRETVQDEEEHVLYYLETREQVQDFLLSTSPPSSLHQRSLLSRFWLMLSPSSSRLQRKRIIIRLSSKLFGRPTMSLSFNQQWEMFQFIGQEYRPHHLLVEGTIMGRFFSGEMIALALVPTPPPPPSVRNIIPPRLQKLEIQSGLAFDVSRSVTELALGLQSCQHTLKHICLRNFLYYVVPLEDDDETTMVLLDPILQALSPSTTASSKSMSKLEYVEISCLASFRNWKRPLIPSNVFRNFIRSSCRTLQHLELTNLGLEDDHISELIEAIQEHEHEQEKKSMSSSSSSSLPVWCCPLQELIWNANENSINGLSTIIEKGMTVRRKRSVTEDQHSSTVTNTTLQPPVLSHLTTLRVMNHVKLNQHVFELLYGVLQHQRHYPAPTANLSETMGKIGKGGEGMQFLLQHFDCTLPITRQCHYRSCIDVYLKLHQLPLTKYYYTEYDNTTKSIDAVRNSIDHIVAPSSEAADQTNDINVLYLLIREKPLLCDIERNRMLLLLQNDDGDEKSRTFISIVRRLNTTIPLVVFSTIVMMMMLLMVQGYARYSSRSSSITTLCCNWILRRLGMHDFSCSMAAGIIGLF